MKKILALCLLLLLLAGCGQNKQTTETIFAMDTVMTLTIYDSGAHADLVLSESCAEIRRLEDMLSVTAPDSEIARLNQGDAGALSSETRSLLRSAMEIAAGTDGAYDPTVYALMELWGFYDDDCSVPAEDALQEALAHTGYGSVSLKNGAITLPEGMGVDLGGIAKGCTSEKVLEVMAAEGVASAIVSLGGNVGALGLKPDGSMWTVAIRDPSGAESDYVATLSLGQAEGCVYAVTSGAYERYFEQDGVRYHHILDPKTGYPADSDLLSVTVVSQDGTLADALSTALFVKGFDGAVDFWRTHMDAFEMVLVKEDGIYATGGLTVSAETAVQTLEVTP